MKKLLGLVLAVVMVLSMIATAYGAAKDVDIKGEDIITFEITVFSQGGMYVPPQDDIVGRAIENATNVRITLKDVYYEKQGNWTDELNLFAAADNWPDVLVFPTSGIDTVSRFSDNFLELSSYITDETETPNLHNVFGDMLDLFTNMQGEYLYWPLAKGTPDLTDPNIKRDYPDVWYGATTTPYYLLGREDILTDMGYTFTSTADLIAKVESTGERLTLEDLAFDPSIETMDDLNELLYAIQDKGYTNKEGLPVVPLSGADPSFSMGGIYGFCFFRITPEDEVHANFGNPYSKIWYQQMNTWVRDGILDKDIWVLKNEQRQQKIATGQVAIWDQGWLGGEQELRALLQENYGTDVRPIPMPYYREDIKRGCDDSYPSADQGLLINKSMENVDALIAYLDWLYSDEGQFLSLWGDGEGTVWEYNSEGKPVFIDEEYYQKAIVEDTKTKDGRDRNYYGLAGFSPYTFIGNRNKLMNPNWYTYSYPPAALDGYQEIRRIAGSVMRDYTSEQMTSIPHGEYAANANNFFWAQANNYTPQVILAEDDQTFEENWDILMEEFMYTVGDYEQMQKDMRPYIGR
jgi:hypothetical protein